MTLSGTSMATPLVAGWAAILKSSNPSYTSGQLREKLIEYSVKDAIKNLPPSTVNRFINVDCPLPTVA
ncbi:hypothetical protein B4U80_14039 [Leptotrombidium deliense]|uniref:Peptidase S8/S53 domain-containing protein n=1 Tax=Leptotrombidium deliense TaxID=299467 RepID=A0A443S4H3_9ACAR|nr:hypothetical protein B4U80_14039 [Leptotrombidium deliense]